MKDIKKKLYFFVRHYPTYDHFAPIIYLLSKNKYIDLNIVYLKVNYAYHLDKHHIYFEKINNITIIDHTKVFKKKRFYLFLFIKFLKRVSSFLLTQIIIKLIFKIENVMEVECEKEIVNILKRKIINTKVSAVFDYAASERIKELKHLIYKSGGQCFNMPHSVWIWENKLRCLDQLSFNTSDSFSFGTFDKKDINIIENNKTKEILKELGVLGKNIKLFGSPRFANKWVMNKKNILSERKFICKGNIKVLILCPKIWDNIFWGEFIRSVNLFANQKSMSVVIQRHPNTSNLDNKLLFKDIMLRDNLQFASKKNSTSELIDWSSIVVNVNASIFFEALIKRKIFINLNHLHTNQFFFDSKGAYYETKNRDDVVDFINNLVKKGNIIKYKQKNIDNLLFKTVYKKTSNPHEEVVNYLENFSL